MTKFWFRTKKYGWGWTPASVEGWLVVAAFFVATALDVVVLIYRTQHGATMLSTLVEFYVCLAVLVAVLLVICWKTGEPPCWQWGS